MKHGLDLGQSMPAAPPIQHEARGTDRTDAELSENHDRIHQNRDGLSRRSGKRKVGGRGRGQGGRLDARVTPWRPRHVGNLLSTASCVRFVGTFLPCTAKPAFLYFQMRVL